MPVELFLSYDEHLDWLTLIEFGRVENAQPRDHWRGVSESFGYLLLHPGLWAAALSHILALYARVARST